MQTLLGRRAPEVLQSCKSFEENRFAYPCLAFIGLDTGAGSGISWVVGDAFLVRRDDR